MVIDPLAPWAEPVLYTADDLMALSDGEWRYELVHGRVVRMPPTNLEHSDICAALYLALRSHVDEHHLGRVTMPETGLIVSDPSQPDTVLAPDLAFIRADRLPEPGSQATRSFPRLAPDLVVEVASPSQHRPQVAANARLWLSAGTRMVWVVWPVPREVDVWLNGVPGPATLGSGDTIDGGDVLSGFRFLLARPW